MRAFDSFFNGSFDLNPVWPDGLKKAGILKATGIYPAKSMSADNSYFEDPAYLREFPLNQPVRTTKPSSDNLHHLQRDFLHHQAGLPPTKKRNNTRNGALHSNAF